MSEPSEKVEILRIATRQVSLEEYCSQSEPIRKGPVFSRLSSEQKMSILEGGKVAAYRAGECIVEMGRGAERPALVLTGSVSLQSYSLCEISMICLGDIFGLESIYPQCPKLGARAREEVRLAWLDPRAVAH